MNKAIFIIVVTSHLLYHAVSEQQRWADVEQEYGSNECMENLGLKLEEACQNFGTISVETVNFTTCKMGCKNETISGFVNITYNIPDNIPCGFFGETCQNGTCMGDCDLPAPHGCIRRPTTGHSS
uniref:Putative ixostatin n=1 Tax=Ixodes ricinus TaxID=34613 RepID=A0A0K8R424_IXORI